MGIPFFFKHLSQKHGKNLFTRDIKCDYLCLDFNSLIHRCAQHHDKQSVLYDSALVMRADIFRSIVNYTRRIIDIVKPGIRTYLAIDGVPPLAKIYQQRTRRYMSMKERSFKGVPCTTGVVRWDSNVVTPGTTFMKELSQHLANAFKDDTTIDLSDWTVPDEGEHKIFKYLETCCAKNAVVYGLDADMIMLSLIRSGINITLMREREELDISNPLPHSFNFVSITKLKKAISNHSHDDDVILDYVFMCLLIGNDFLPPLSHLRIANNDVDRLLRAYDTAVASRGKRIAHRVPHNGSHVDFGVVLELLNELKVTEDAGMVHACKIYYAQTVPRDTSVIDHQWNRYPVIHKFKQGVIDPSKAGWRVSYYHNLFGQRTVVSTVVEKYLEGLEWNIRYYLTNTAPEAQWFYEHSYSPTILDCCNFLEANKSIRPDWHVKYMGSPKITPLMQLLCVISPLNKSIIPRKYQKIMTDIRLGCMHLFPSDFEVFTFLKTFVWECHPHLAPIDIRTIATAIANVKKNDKRGQ